MSATNHHCNNASDVYWGRKYLVVVVVVVIVIVVAF